MAKTVLNIFSTVTVNDNDVELFTFYRDFDRRVSMEISDQIQTVGGISFLEGELIYENIGWESIDFTINKDGELIAIGGESSKFAISDDGNLTVTE